MALYTCDDPNCVLYNRGQSFDYSFSCQRTTSSIGVPCRARELPAAEPSRSQTAPTVAGGWGLERSGSYEETAFAPQERETEYSPRDRETEYASGDRSPPPPPPAPEPERRGSSTAIILLSLLVVLLIGGGIGTYAMRDTLFGAGGSGADSPAMIEERLFATLLRAAYAREISDKILSVNRQIEAIRQRDEASSPAMAREIAEIEARMQNNEVERRAAFNDCAAEVERLGKTPADDVDAAVDALTKRLDGAGLKRLKALLPVIVGQIRDSRAGKADRDKWISQIEVASL
ncbi:hypothetical protein [Sphingomonas sanxanigenens]|uniref:Uncharacterized protein n=1 Tax=Sphingomonas sanxanigenens DSM 19645 = NX02 TaxID=1123269 RepID=W0A8F9_9SPHN|nr:hypothetical protein [Sphingomonas sanxanigenens]AHE53386.1 hypothetical protein NX02_08310 [Sphingomonas sanxanigenens DSM 19645 = NX02]